MIWGLLASVLNMLNLKSVQPFVLYSSQRTSEAFSKETGVGTKKLEHQKGLKARQEVLLLNNL